LGTKAIGCSENQEFIANTSLYIKVQSIDFLDLLKEDPNSLVGKISYESNNPNYGLFPFPMNKELYNRMQNINQPYSIPAGSPYFGKSLQNLFDITYVESYVNNVGQTITGNFYKIDLVNRENNNVVEFLKDYYSTINFIDIKNFYAQLVNLLTGAIQIKKGSGNIALTDFNKVLIIMRRIFGLCFDSEQEIDVGGTAKVSPNDKVDDSFFSFSEIDLRILERTVEDIKQGVYEFVDCDNVKVRIKPDPILEAVNQLNLTDGTNNNNQINDAANLTDVISNGFFPIQVDFDDSFLKEFPNALVMSLLSPKVILPIMIMAKSLNKTFVDEINSFLDFVDKMRTYFVSLVSKVIALFIKILYDIVYKDIKALVARLTNDIAREKTKKYENMVLSLTTLLVQIANIVNDFRQCNAIINQLQGLVTNVQKRTESLPLPLLLASRLRKGFSKTSAFLRVISKFEELGLPTGPMPDGSPNLMLASIKSIIDGIDDEMAENGRVDIGVAPLTVILGRNSTNPISIYGIPV